MKKLLSIILVLIMVLSGCGKGNDNKGTDAGTTEAETLPPLIQIENIEKNLEIKNNELDKMFEIDKQIAKVNKDYKILKKFDILMAIICAISSGLITSNFSTSFWPLFISTTTTFLASSAIGITFDKYRAKKERENLNYEKECFNEKEIKEEIETLYKEREVIKHNIDQELYKTAKINDSIKATYRKIVYGIMLNEEKLLINSLNFTLLSNSNVLLIISTNLVSSITDSTLFPSSSYQPRKLYPSFSGVGNSVTGLIVVGAVYPSANSPSAKSNSTLKNLSSYFV